MKGWILSIVGIVFIGVILDVILPDGKTSKFIKHIFSIFLMFMVISPITKLSVNSNWFNNNLVVDSNFIYKTNIQKIDALTERIKQELNKIEINNAEVVIYSNVFNEDLIINSVYVDLSNSNIILSEDIKNKVINVVTSVLNVAESEVNVYGR